MQDQRARRSVTKNIVAGTFRPRLASRRRVSIELPEFVICALEARVAEANDQLETHDRATIEDYIESELVNLITVRDVAEMDAVIPGYANAVEQWLNELR
jgi:hypothetical protein